MVVVDFILGIIGSLTGVGAMIIAYLAWRSSGPRVRVRMGYKFLDGANPGEILHAVMATAVNRGALAAHIDQVDFMSEIDVVDMTVNPLPGSDPTKCDIEPHDKRSWYFGVDEATNGGTRPVRARAAVLLATGEHIRSRNFVPLPLAASRGVKLRSRLVMLRFKLRRKFRR